MVEGDPGAVAQLRDPGITQGKVTREAASQVGSGTGSSRAWWSPAPPASAGPGGRVYQGYRVPRRGQGQAGQWLTGACVSMRSDDAMRFWVLSVWPGWPTVGFSPRVGNDCGWGWCSPSEMGGLLELRLFSPDDLAVPPPLPSARRRAPTTPRSGRLARQRSDA